jgi:hypothetical protein
MARNRIDDQDLGDILLEYEKGLFIDKNALDEALEQQPDIFYRVSKTYAQLISLRDQAKQELQEVEADTDLDIRKVAARDEEKITEGEIKARVRIDKEVKKANERYMSLTNQAAQYGALKEAFMQRSYVLKDLTQLYSANYYGANVESAKGDMRDHKAARVRREQTKMRRERD